MSISTEKKYLTITQLNEYVRMLMDSDGVLSSIAVRGEISNFKRHYSGHLYFSLKDAGACVKCVMFASAANGLKFMPKDGSDVVAYGRVSVFPRDGVYQLYVSSMIDAGTGDRYAAFERLKKKLEAEGLFDPARKKNLPPFPKKIGIVTSPTGAAVRDLISILGRRYPLCEVVLFPALVQGPGAAASVASGIGYFNNRADIDIIIEGRGGGSFEDLDCFNDEQLCRTIAASNIPVISAVGHETDFTVSDFVADLRAATPSAAAELAVPDMSDLLDRMSGASQRLRTAVSKRISDLERILASLSASPALASPERLLDLYDAKLLSLATSLDSSYSSKIDNSEKNLLSLASSLEAMSPLKVLSRGYTLVTSDGGLVKNASELSEGDKIEISFRDGSADAVVTGVKND